MVWISSETSEGRKALVIQYSIALAVSATQSENGNDIK